VPVAKKWLPESSKVIAAYFGEAGHAFRVKADRCSREAGQSERSDAGVFCFYSACRFSVKLIFCFRIDSPFMLIRYVL
jgi:hypothetical protein